MQRAFTLLEVLVVVLLLVLIGSIVGPVAISQIGRTSLDEAHRQLEAAAMLARADAQRRGAVVQLWVRPGDAAGLVPAELVSTDLFAPDSFARRAAATASPDSAGASSPARTPLAHSVLSLPPGIQLASRLPARFMASSDAEPVDAAFETFNQGNTERGSGGEEALIPLCLFFPDGQISPSEPLYLSAKSGRALAVQVNRWTGSITVTPIEVPGTPSDHAISDESASPDASPPARGAEPEVRR